MSAEAKSKILDFKGLISAPFTAFSENGEINLKVIPAYIDFLVQLGVKGAFVNGTTGEGLSLTVNERKQIAEEWVKYGENKLFPIIIQIAANSLKDAQELAKHAEDIGATAIASLPPLYYKSPDLDHVIAYLKAIATKAPSLPFFLYHIPSFSGVEIDFGKFLPRVKKEIPSFCGVKYTSIDVRQLLKSQRTSNTTKFLTGFDEVLLPCISCGLTAAIGASYNFMAPLSLKLLHAYEAGDMKTATSLQQTVADAVEKIVSHGQSISAFKATMNIISPFNFGNPRLPLIPLTSDQKDQLRLELEKLQATEWIKPFKSP